MNQHSYYQKYKSLLKFGDEYFSAGRAFESFIAHGTNEYLNRLVREKIGVRERWW